MQPLEKLIIVNIREWTDAGFHIAETLDFRNYKSTVAVNPADYMPLDGVYIDDEQVYGLRQVFEERPVRISILC